MMPVVKYGLGTAGLVGLGLWFSSNGNETLPPPSQTGEVTRASENDPPSQLLSERYGNDVLGNIQVSQTDRIVAFLPAAARPDGRRATVADFAVAGNIPGIISVGGQLEAPVRNKDLAPTDAAKMEAKHAERRKETMLKRRLNKRMRKEFRAEHGRDVPFPPELQKRNKETRDPEAIAKDPQKRTQRRRGKPH